MHSARFFNQSPINLPQEEDNTLIFLTKFPALEFWRLFVEKKRYHYCKTLTNNLNETLANKKLDALPSHYKLEEKEIEKLTLNDLYEGHKRGLYEMPLILAHYEKQINNKIQENVNTLISKHEGFRGFEDLEPGYLNGMAKGWNYIINSLIAHTDFDINFIKNLHKICTEDVKYMLDQEPGAFRKYGTAWKIELDTDTQNGFMENIEYMKLEANKKSIGFIINFINLTDEARLFNLQEKNLDQILWRQFIRKQITLKYIVNEDSHINKTYFLKDVSEKHLNNFNNSLLKPMDKNEKLTAIFTFLKYSILHHPFQDGVGRTYSMLLLQYLLMRENLLPVLLNSNIIPGYAINELVEQYLQAEKEMQKILNDSSYINSHEVNNPNIHTQQLCDKLNYTELAAFHESLRIFKAANQNYISTKNSFKLSNKL